MRKIKIESAIEITPQQLAVIADIFSQVPANEPKKNLKGDLKNGAD